MPRVRSAHISALGGVRPSAPCKVVTSHSASSIHRPAVAAALQRLYYIFYKVIMVQFVLKKQTMHVSNVSSILHLRFRIQIFRIHFPSLLPQPRPHPIPSLPTQPPTHPSTQRGRGRSCLQRCHMSTTDDGFIRIANWVRVASYASTFPVSARPRSRLNGFQVEWSSLARRDAKDSHFSRQ